MEGDVPGTSARLTTLATDAGGADGALEPDTVREYLAALERLVLVEDVPAWAPSLRSRARLRTAPTRHFVDPSLAVAALRATPATLLADLELLAFARTVDTHRTGAPAFLAVVTATGYGYTRPDGVHVLPVAALGP